MLSCLRCTPWPACMIVSLLLLEWLEHTFKGLWMLGTQGPGCAPEQAEQLGGAQGLLILAKAEGGWEQGAIIEHLPPSMRPVMALPVRQPAHMPDRYGMFCLQPHASLLPGVPELLMGCAAYENAKTLLPCRVGWLPGPAEPFS